MEYVIINGIRSTTIKGFLIQSLPPISKPLMRTSIEEIDGRDGDVVTKLGYSAYDKEMSIGLFGDFDIDEVISFFDSEGTIIFSNEPDKFYNFQIINQIDFEKLLRFKTATITFHVQPFKYSAVDDNFSFTNDEMRLKIYSVANSGITINQRNNTITIQGTATRSVEFYLPINEMNLKAQAYTLKANASGTGANALEMRVIGERPIDSDSFGGSSIQLQSGETTLTAILTAPKAFNYIWLYIPNGTVLDLSLEVHMINNNLDSCDVINRGNTISRPVLTFYGSGDIVLSINGEELFIIHLGNDEFITLDGIEMNAYKGNALKNRQVIGDYANLQLKVGRNEISWTGNVSRLEIGNVSRWI